MGLGFGFKVKLSASDQDLGFQCRAEFSDLVALPSTFWHLLGTPGHFYLSRSAALPERSPVNSRLAPPILGALNYIYIANQTQTGPKGCGSNLCLKVILNLRHKSEPGTRRAGAQTLRVPGSDFML